MPRLHVLQQTSNNLYNVVVHAPMPAGNNAAGVSWSVALQNAGLAGTSMTVGNGPGQISQSEANQVAAGTLLEAPFQWGDDPAWDNATRIADLNTRAQQAVDATVTEFQTKLKHFGRTVT